MTQEQLELWLETESLEEILEENDLEHEDVLEFLWKHGLIKTPTWLEHELSQETE